MHCPLLTYLGLLDTSYCLKYWPNSCFQFNVAYETATVFADFKKKTMKVGKIDCQRSMCDKERKVNVLQIYQNDQNALAAIKGCKSTASFGQLAQSFNIHNENGCQGLFRPTGHFRVPLNIMFSARWLFNYGLNFGLYIPFYIMELKNVEWHDLTDINLAENCLTTDLSKLICDKAKLDINGWRRSGPGDLVALLQWIADFPQNNKPFLKSVRVNGRFGIDFPVGKRQDEDKILAIPFGNDGSWGVQMAGGLDLTFAYYIRGGIDAEFLYLFGNTRERRIKIDCNQTDLLFLTKLPAFREFGLSQQYNIYLETFNICSGLSLKFNYQYLRRNGDRLFVCSDRVDSVIVNNAESLQDWTAHSLIFSLGYDYGYKNPLSRFIPAVKGWFKYGFNGKRAILANTFGIELTLSF